jgi:succinate dehydrogenase / fumarate reductase membrane anchor subunit
MVKRVIVGAHYGLRSWLIQRVSALVMAIYTVLMAVVLVASPVGDYAGWQQLFANPWMQYATFLFIAGLMLHAWVGMRDILMDYVPATGLRFALEVVVILALIVYAAWSVRILWGN